MKRWLEAQVEANISHSEGILSRFIGMKNTNKLDPINIDKILTE